MEERVTDPRMHLWEQKAWFYEATFGTRCFLEWTLRWFLTLRGRRILTKCRIISIFIFMGRVEESSGAILLGMRICACFMKRAWITWGNLISVVPLIIQRLWDYFNQLPNIYAYLEEDDWVQIQPLLFWE